MVNMAIVPGQAIKQYIIEKKIGEGGMGSVYTAQQPSMNRRVVIKVLSAKILKTPEMLRRFQREVEIIARLEHPHIVPVYDYGDIEGNPFIAMRYLGGGSLHDRLQSATIPRRQLLRSLEQIAEALDYAHAYGVIHRDLKPGNILFDEQSNAYLADFGIAKAMTGDMDLTETGGIVGTPAYMSPEQARGEKLDGRSDIYSLGIMTYQTLAGRLPFNAKTVWEWIDSHVAAPVPSIVAATPDLPPAVDQVFQQVMAKEVDQRPAKATEFIRSLNLALQGNLPDAIGRGTPSAAKTTALAGAATVHADSAATVRQTNVLATGAGAGSVVTTPGHQSSSFLIWAILGVAVLILGAGALLALGSGAFLVSQRSQGLAVVTYPAGDSPRSLVFDGEAIWVANFFDSTVSRLQATNCGVGGADPCGRALGTYHVDNLPLSLAYDGRRLWVASALNGNLTQLDPATGAEVARYNLPHLPTTIVNANGTIWVVHTHAETERLTRIEADGRITGQYDIDEAPFGMVFAGDYLWISSQGDAGSLSQFDPAQAAVVQRLAVEGKPGALAFDGRSLWVALESDNSVLQVNPENGRPGQKIRVGRQPMALLFDGRDLWTANAGDNSVSRIDIGSGRVIDTISVAGGPFALAWVPCGPDCADLWIAGEANDTVSRIRVR
jgi:YVTN family beta-propeller protein